MSLINTVVKLDGNFYSVVQGSFVRRWTRSFSSNLAANIVRLNFVDRGPGIRVYDFQIQCRTWEPSTLPYLQGATLNFDAQRTGLEASYSKVATPLNFLDIFGEPPTFAGTAASPITAGNTSIQINSALAQLLASPPSANGTYPYNLYIWAQGTSLGQGLAGTATLDTVSVSALSGTTLTVSSVPHSWSSGCNLAVYLGLYITNLNQIDAPDGTSANPRVIYEVELTEATQVVA